MPNPQTCPSASSNSSSASSTCRCCCCHGAAGVRVGVAVAGGAAAYGKWGGAALLIHSFHAQSVADVAPSLPQHLLERQRPMQAAILL